MCYNFQNVLISEGGFKGLFLKSSVEDFQENFGIHKGHAEILVAIGEIIRRNHGTYDSFDVSTPDMVSDQFDFLRKAKQEQCHILHVDEKSRGIFQSCIGIGGGSDVTVNFTDILRDAVLART